MTFNQILGPEDEEEDEKTKAAENEAELEVEIEGEEDEERPAKQRAQEGEEGLSDEEKRNLRRDRKKRQKERARLAKDRDKAMISGLQETVANLNAKLNKLAARGEEDEEGKLKTMLRNASNRAEMLKAEITRANEAGESQKVADAIDELTTVKADIQKMQDIAGQRVQARKDAEAEEKNAGAEEELEIRRRIAKTVSNNVKIFSDAHPWYVMSEDETNDTEEDEIEDSERVRELEAQLANSGSNPATAKHWQQLEKMVRKELPHRFDADEEEQERQKSRTNGKRRPMTAGSGRGAPGNGDGKGYKLSKERVQAMKDAGIWDDPKAKERQIKAFQRWDKEHVNG